ncbi:MAG: glycosyltransferase family 39 protein [Methylococcaceae bacterium]
MTTASESLLVQIKTGLLVSDKNQLRLVAFLLIYLAAWTLMAGWLPLSMDVDSIEEVVWSQTWQWGYYKHPPLPSLMLYELNAVFGGPYMSLTVFAAQGCSVVSLIYVWLLARKILPGKLAIVAVLITSLIYYNNLRAVEFNHNTASLPFTAAAIYFFYCSIRTPERLLNWFLLGVACGLAMLTKYSAVLVFAGFFVTVVWQRLWANPLVIRGLLVTILVFILLFSLNVFWLVEHDWLPFNYLDEYLDNQLNSFASRLRSLINFTENQALRLSYMLVAVWLLKKFSPRKVMVVNTPESSRIHNDHRFLMIMLFTPLILALLPMLLKGSFLSSNWVSAFFLPAGIVLVSCFFRQHDEARLLKNTQYLVWAIQVIILLGFFVGTVLYPAMAGCNVKSNFPGKLLAERVTDIWSEHQQQPLTIVIANTWLGGNIMLHIRPEPTLLIDNNTIISPWVSRQDIASCGALVLTTGAEKASPDYSALFDPALIIGTFSLPWGHAPQGTVEEYTWAILAPEPNQPACKLRLPS